MGWGHLNRGRSLWEAAAEEVQILVGRGFEEVTSWARGSGVRLPLVAWRTGRVPLDPATGKYDVLIVDNYDVDGEWIETASLRLPTFVIDDWMRGRIRTTALVNPNVGARQADYPEANVAQWLLGPRYALLRRDVLNARPVPHERKVANEILVTLGGSDPDGRASQVVAVLSELEWHRGGGRLTVVLGASYSGAYPWQEWAAGHPTRREVLVWPPNFVSRCASADLVICGASTTTYELAFMGRPFVPIALVDNQARVVTAWQNHEVGSGLSVWRRDWLSHLCREVERLAGDWRARAALAQAASVLVDGQGARRLLAACHSACAKGEM